MPIFISRMKAFLDVETLVESATPQLTEMARVGASFPNPQSEEAYAQFSHQVSMLEGALKQTFRAATLLARKNSELAEIADVWQRMSRFCDAVLLTLSSLKENYAHCGTPELYDLALDFKQACEDRLRDVQEEMECQKIDLPKGLLPELS